MRILITGASGYIGSHIFSFYAKYSQIEVIPIYRETCNLLHLNELKQFFNKNGKFDIVIHTAICGINRNIEYSKEIVYNNLLMIFNLISMEEYYNILINIGSGNQSYLGANNSDAYFISKNIVSKAHLGVAPIKEFQLYITNAFLFQQMFMLAGI